MSLDQNNLHLQQNTAGKKVKQKSSSRFLNNICNRLKDHPHDSFVTKKQGSDDEYDWLDESVQDSNVGSKESNLESNRDAIKRVGSYMLS